MDELTINFGSPFGSLTIISSYERQWAQQGSNLRPLACKASALPLSYAPVPPSGYPGRQPGTAYLPARPGREPALEDRVTAVRAFNRLYASVIGLPQEGLLATPYSLTEARVIFELAGQTWRLP